MSKGGKSEEALRALLPASVAVRFDEMFPSLRARTVRRRDRKRADMLRKAEPVLQRALGPMEVVRFVTSGARQLAWGLVTAGSMNPFTNRTTFVLTDRRILLIHTDRKGRPRMFASQLPLERIETTSGRHSYIFIRSGREQLMFHGTKRGEAKYLRRLLDTTPIDEGGWQNLCPRCFFAMDDAPDTCTGCGEPFKSPRKAALRSLVFPGLGDFYLGYRGYAVLQTFGAGLLWAMFLTVLVPAVRARGFEGVLIALPVLAFVALVHGGDAILTWAKARSGLHSRDGALPTGTAPAKRDGPPPVPPAAYAK
ncbi:MAG: hypothetical protein WBG86_00925 [Polyangiales bacterium]